jgi:hypothetical protein
LGLFKHSRKTRYNTQQSFHFKLFFCCWWYVMAGGWGWWPRGARLVGLKLRSLDFPCSGFNFSFFFIYFFILEVAIHFFLFALLSSNARVLEWFLQGIHAFSLSFNDLGNHKLQSTWYLRCSRTSQFREMLFNSRSVQVSPQNFLIQQFWSMTPDVLLVEL